MLFADTFFFIPYRFLCFIWKITKIRQEDLSSSEYAKFDFFMID